MKTGAGFLVSRRGISWKALIVSVLTLSFLTLTCFFCGEIAYGLEAKQALDLQTVSQAEKTVATYLYVLLAPT